MRSSAELKQQLLDQLTIEQLKKRRFQSVGGTAGLAAALSDGTGNPALRTVRDTGDRA
jgi:hypothetical protein